MSSRRSNSSTIFIGKLSSRLREEDLRDEFRRYGRIRDIDFRRQRGFAFIEYNSSSDARQAVEEMNGQRFEDTRIVVQYKESNSDRSRRGPSTVDLCFNCGRKGHWANDCKEGNWNNKCYRCGRGGHLKKDCSLSRTPSSRRNSPARRSRKSKYSNRSRSVSESRSRSRDRTKDRKRRQSYSKSSSRSSSSKSSRKSHSSSKSRRSSSKSKSRSPSSSRENRRNRKSRSRSNSNGRSRKDSTNDRNNNNNSNNRSPIKQ